MVVRLAVGEVGVTVIVSGGNSSSNRWRIDCMHIEKHWVQKAGWLPKGGNRYHHPGDESKAIVHT